MRIFDIMKSKLNITIDEELLTGAKLFAARNQTSLSQLVEAYFRKITSPNRKNIIDLIESLPRPGLESKGDLKKKYYEDQKKKYGF